MKNLNVAKWICGVLCLLGFVFPVSDASAGIAHNSYYSLDDTAAPIEPPPGWTQMIPGGTRNGFQINTGVGVTKFYTRNDIAIDADQNWSIEAEVSSAALGGVGECGARVSIKFSDASALMLPPAGINKFRHIELRLEEDATDNRRFALVDGNDNSEEASLALDWSDTAPRWRIRIKRDGTNIIMEAEPAHTGPLYTDPLNYPVPPPHTVTVPISNFSFPAGTNSQFGFGHFVAGAYNSYWESIHVTAADDSTTVLPYWPSTPPTPLLTHDDKGIGNPQGIDLSADLTTGGYLINDSAIAELDADGTTYFGDTRVNPGVEVWDFDNLGDNQTVHGRVAVSDVSGRSTTGSDGSAVIPSSTAIPTLSEWGMIIFALLLLTVGMFVIRRRRDQ